MAVTVPALITAAAVRRAPAERDAAASSPALSPLGYTNILSFVEDCGKTPAELEGLQFLLRKTCWKNSDENSISERKSNAEQE